MTTKATDSKNTSTQEILQQLANLQFIDSKIDELTRMQGDLPEEIADIETDVARLEAQNNRLQAEQKELELEKSNLELEIQDAEELVKKYEEQQLSVRNNREYDALTKEIDTQKQVIENANSRLEEIAMLKDENAKKLEEIQQELENTRSLLKEKQDKMDELVKSNKAEENELKKKREEAAKNLDQRYLKSYERLRKGLNNGKAVVPMEKGSSNGMMLPPQTQVEVRRKNKVVIDEHSGRIVIDQSFFEEAAKIYGK